MLQFFVASIIVGIAPGPDNLFVLSQSASSSAKSGFAVILGLCTGIIVQTYLLIAGVSAIIAASPFAFFVLQCIGAFYLLFLAYKSFKVKAKTVDLNITYKVSFKLLYLRGIAMNLTNPKAILFMLSFIPPAVNMQSLVSPTIQIAILGAEFLIATFIVFSLVAILASVIKKFMLRSPKAIRNLNWFSGIVFICLAIGIFFA